MENLCYNPAGHRLRLLPVMRLEDRRSAEPGVVARSIDERWREGSQSDDQFPVTSGGTRAKRAGEIPARGRVRAWGFTDWRLVIPRVIHEPLHG
jgi:hypothetical protein